MSKNVQLIDLCQKILTFWEKQLTNELPALKKQLTNECPAVIKLLTNECLALET